jgi:crotonobetainyl-CoA:carnitine CoA-transferase CaiB-like acyl-CoA transferase
MTGTSNTPPNPQANRGPLQSLRVLDIGTIIAAPLASTLLADFGADVLKVEIPGDGDGLRMLPPHKDNAPLWWKVTNRNKKAVTLDLRKPAGAELFKKMLPHFDVLVTNFRPGTLERWGLGPDVIQEIHPGITILRVSAFGQTGPYAQKPGFARVADAMSGFQSLNGDGDRAPLHTGYPVADTICGLYGALGILAALMELKNHPEDSRKGQVVDVSLVESMFRMLDFLAIGYDQLGSIPERSGNLSTYSSPSNVFATRDKKWVTVAASTQSMFVRLVNAVDRADLLDDPRFTCNIERLKHREELDAILAQWFVSHDAEQVCQRLEKFEVAAAPVLDIADIFNDPHYKAANMIVSVPDQELGEVRMQNVHPHFSRTPGAVTSTGPTVGEHNAEVYSQLLGLQPDEIRDLQEQQVI